MEVSQSLTAACFPRSGRNVVASDSPSFQFNVSRTSTGEQLFSTWGHVLVYEDQFLELATNMVPNYNVYGLGRTDMTESSASSLTHLRVSRKHP